MTDALGALKLASLVLLLAVVLVAAGTGVAATPHGGYRAATKAETRAMATAAEKGYQPFASVYHLVAGCAYEIARISIASPKWGSYWLKPKLSYTNSRYNTCAPVYFNGSFMEHKDTAGRWTAAVLGSDPIDMCKEIRTFKIPPTIFKSLFGFGGSC